jgi:hypothetical protein
VYYIEYLLFNRLAIKLKEDLEAEDLNDLIILEKKIMELLNNDFISNEDLDLLDKIINAKSIYILAKEMNTDYRTLQSFLNSITTKLSMCLGSVFTDEGYLEKICSNNNLTHDEIQKVREYISKPYRGE